GSGGEFTQRHRTAAGGPPAGGGGGPAPQVSPPPPPTPPARGGGGGGWGGSCPRRRPPPAAPPPPPPRRPVTLRELATTPLLWREPGSGTRDAVWEILGAECQPARPAAELGSATAIVASARAGVAPAVLSRLIAAPHLDNGTITEVRTADSVVLTRNFRAIWRRQAPPSGPAEVLVRCAAGGS
ncbi:LysR substrate-binding domain-containing protein, partial [Nocardia abscessus]|uniref:LysR substrate-binding domain-containing protein n=1 Tax=Nocardia abscessus TaxID=120957 RepID=UPI0024549103